MIIIIILQKENLCTLQPFFLLKRLTFFLKRKFLKMFVYSQTNGALLSHLRCIHSVAL